MANPNVSSVPNISVTKAASVTSPRKKVNGKNRLYFSPAVKMLANQEMQKINNGQEAKPRRAAISAVAVMPRRVPQPFQTHAEPQQGTTVVEFWDNTYFPFISKHKNPGHREPLQTHLGPTSQAALRSENLEGI
jgi:hypothetical protein